MLTTQDLDLGAHKPTQIKSIALAYIQIQVCQINLNLKHAYRKEPEIDLAHLKIPIPIHSELAPDAANVMSTKPLGHANQGLVAQRLRHMEPMTQHLSHLDGCSLAEQHRLTC
jgi:hypothetical protein